MDYLYDDIILVFYSHTDYIDIAIPSIHRIKKFWSNIKICLCVNNADIYKKEFPNEFKYIYEYNDTTSFCTRVLPLLEQIQEKYIILNLDILILVDKVNEKLFEKIYAKVISDDIDQLRLFTTGIGNPDSSIVKDSLVEIKTGYFFSVLTTLWKKKTLIDLFTKFINKTHRNIESDEVHQYIKTNFKSYTVFTKECVAVTNLDHYFCPSFPFVRLTGFGKWNMDCKFHIEKTLELSYEFNLNLASRKR